MQIETPLKITLSKSNFIQKEIHDSKSNSSTHLSLVTYICKGMVGSSKRDIKDKSIYIANACYELTVEL